MGMRERIGAAGTGRPAEEAGPGLGSGDRRRRGVWAATARWVRGAVLALLAATGCDGGITIPDRAPFMDGELQGVNDVDFTLVDFAPGFGWEAPDVIESLLVREDGGDPCGVTWTVDGSTDLLVREGSALRRATPDDLVPFGNVRVWAVGDVVAESCPGQGLAATVELR